MRWGAWKRFHMLGSWSWGFCRKGMDFCGERSRTGAALELRATAMEKFGMAASLRGHQDEGRQRTSGRWVGSQTGRNVAWRRPGVHLGRHPAWFEQDLAALHSQPWLSSASLSPDTSKDGAAEGERRWSCSFCHHQCFVETAHGTAPLLAGLSNCRLWAGSRHWLQQQVLLGTDPSEGSGFAPRKPLSSASAKFKGKERKEISKQVCLGSKQKFLLAAKKKICFEGQYFYSSGRGSEGALLCQGYFLIQREVWMWKIKASLLHCSNNGTYERSDILLHFH